MIVTDDLWFEYSSRDGYILKNINLEIEEGELVSIMGDNGAGKTTLVKHFNGLLKPTKGDVFVDNMNTKKVAVSELAKRVALVFQYPEKMFFSENVWDEVAFSLKNFGYNENMINRQVEKILRIFWLWEYKDKSPFMLSGGEQRRLAIASVLVWNPKYVIMDEPTAGQDAIQREIMLNLINMMIKEKKTVVLVTHDVEFVAEINARIILMNKGEIVFDGDAQKIFRDEEALESAGLTQPSLYKLERRLREEDILKVQFNGIRDAANKIVDILRGDLKR